MRVIAFFLLCVICSSTACHHADNADKKAVKKYKKTHWYDTLYHPRQLTITQEDWATHVTISFPKSVDTTGFVIYHVNGIYKNRNLGFILGVPTKPYSDAGFGKGLYFKRTGKESDYFLHTLAEVYHQPLDTTAQFVDSISLHYVDLVKVMENEVNKGHYPTERVRYSYKLFFEVPNGSEEPGELFIRPNETYQVIELAEKDSAYRSAIIKCLTSTGKRK
jgi:hypothetical protein